MKEEDSLEGYHIKLVVNSPVCNLCYVQYKGKIVLKY